MLKVPLKLPWLFSACSARPVFLPRAEWPLAIVRC